MKKITLCLILTCLSGFLSAQTIVPDPDFGAVGMVKTNLSDMNLNPYGYNLAVKPDGSIIMVGDLPGICLSVKKYGNDGTADEGFTTGLPGFSQFQFGASIQQDGKPIVCGYISKAPFYTAVARLNINGGMDASFGNDGIASIFVSHVHESNLLTLANGKTIVFGAEDINNSNIPTVVTRLNSNGTIDSSFGTNGNFRCDMISGPESIPVSVEQADGKLLFAGMAANRLLLLRLNPDGAIDSTFSDDGILIDPMPSGGEAYCLDLQPDEKIIVGGYSNPGYKPITARYLSDGTRDSTFGDAGVQYFKGLGGFQEGVGIEVLPNGKIAMLIADIDEKVVRLAQLLPNGQLDSTFGNQGIYEYPGTNLRPRSIRLTNNTLTISGRNENTEEIFLLRLLLDLNVGILDPKAQPEPSLWVYPNPIAEQFTLVFGLAEMARVCVHLYDLQGKLIYSTVQNQTFEPGEHALSLSCPSDLPAGNYVLTLEVGGKKMTSVQIVKK